MSQHVLFYLLSGASIWGIVLLGERLKRYFLSIPILYVAIGYALFKLPIGLPAINPLADDQQVAAFEYLTEFIVIASLMSAGLAIDRKISWPNWRQVAPLILVTMPLSILAVTLVGWQWLGLGWAAALLLGAVLSPTDPVLARSVQVCGPGKGQRDDVRFNLTAEAGFNDGLAFPFTFLAIALATASHYNSPASLVGQWLAIDVIWRIGAGALVGYVVARLSAWYVFRSDDNQKNDEHAMAASRELIDSNAGLVVVGTLLLAYGCAEAINGYGFISVFIGAVVARQHEPDHDFHKRTHQFMDQLEKLVLATMLLGFGGLLASGLFHALTWPAAAFAIGFVLIIRPVIGCLSLAGTMLPWRGKLATGFLGIRGVGTIYYLSFAQSRAEFGHLDLLWATASLVVLTSIIVHGICARPTMRWLEKHEANRHQGTSQDIPTAEQN